MKCIWERVLHFTVNNNTVLLCHEQYSLLLVQRTAGRMHVMGKTGGNFEKNNVTVKPPQLSKAVVSRDARSFFTEPTYTVDHTVSGDCLV